MREAVAEAQWSNLHPATESLASGEDPSQISSIGSSNSFLSMMTNGRFCKIQSNNFLANRSPLPFLVGSWFFPPQAKHPLRCCLLQPIATPPRRDSLSIPKPLLEESEVEDLIVAIEPGVESTLDEVLLTSDPEEESAQHIAATIAGAQSEIPRPEALRDLMWRLLFEDKISLAFHLTSYIDAQQSQLQPRLPAWLLRTALLGRHVRHAKGETARFLESDFAHCSPALYLPEQGEWNQAVTFLLIVAALQPALLALQTQAPAVLHALCWEANLPHLTAYCKSIADYGAHQHPLDPNLLKKDKEQAAWQTEMDVLKQGVELWWARAARLPLSYAPATKVWQRWLERVMHFASAAAQPV